MDKNVEVEAAEYFELLGIRYRDMNTESLKLPVK